MAWLAVAVTGMLGCAEARAGCDHPWVQRAVHSGIRIPPLVLEPSQLLEAPDSELPQQPQRRSPCARGACSRTPELPGSSTGSTTPRVELWGALPAGAPPLVPGSDPLAPDPESRRPVRLGIPIERPPRIPSTA